MLSVCPRDRALWALATVLSTSTKKQNKAYGKAGGIATRDLSSRCVERILSGSGPAGVVCRFVLQSSLGR